jgi:pimeloyl-ACP methyl ester carboxylesterase
VNETQPPPSERHFVRAAGRQWHYLLSGEGPPLLALHRAPLTAKSLTDLFARTREFTIIAPDLPGHGGTQGFPESASIDDYVRALAEWLDAIGCPPIPVIGDREGALLAVALAGTFPERALAVAAIGLRAQHDRSFPDLTPRADGAHLAALWGYLREDAVFAPAGARNFAHRQLRALPTAAALHERVVQVLRADGQGRAFDRLLRAAAADQPNLGARLSRVRCPLMFTGAADERDDRALGGLGPLAETADRRVAFAADRAGALETALGFVHRNRGGAVSHAAPWRALRSREAHRREPAAAAPAEGIVNMLTSPRDSTAIPGAHARSAAGKTASGTLTRAYVGPAGAQMHFLFNGDVPTVPLLVQHDAASSVGTVRPIVETFVGRRTVYAFDLPGSGDSDDTLPADPVAVEEYAARLLEALDALGVERCDFYGMWGGGFVGLELARLAPGRVRRLVLSNVFFHEGAERERFQAHYTPLVEPVWHGGHLLQAWHQMRDQGLFYPWFDRSEAGVIRREPYLDTDMVHERVCSLLKAGARYRSAYQAHFVYPTLERLNTVRVPTLLATSAWDPNRPHTERAAELNGHCRFLTLDPDFRKWGESFLGFLEEPE